MMPLNITNNNNININNNDNNNNNNNNRRNILNDGTDPMCRICGQYQETIDHIVAGCPELAKTEYLHRLTKPPHTYTGTYAKS